MRINLSLLLVLIVVAMGCKSEQPKSSEETKTTKIFDIRTGVNVSHWLSQSEKRGDERRNYIVKDDFDKIAAMGFDHVRLPIDEEQMWDEEGNKETEAFELMHSAVKWAIEANLKVIVDLHIIRAHYFLNETNEIWTDPAAQQRFMDMWTELSEELHEYPLDMVAYELMNEAVAEDPEDWNKLIAKGIATVRANEPDRVIVVGSNMWQTAHNFPFLKVPENDKNIILSFHFYTPSALTHYKAPWAGHADYTGPVNYPGWIIDTAEYANMSEATLAVMKEHANGNFDKAALQAVMQPAIDVAKEKNLPLYCGEYGIYPSIPEDIALRWYSDVCAIFNENDIAYTHWGYRGDFPVLDEDDNPKALVEVLTK